MTAPFHLRIDDDLLLLVPASTPVGRRDALAAPVGTDAEVERLRSEVAAVSDEAVRTAPSGAVGVLVARSGPDGLRLEGAGEVPVRLRYADGSTRPVVAAVWYVRHVDVVALEVDLAGSVLEWRVPAPRAETPVDPAAETGAAATPAARAGTGAAATPATPADTVARAVEAPPVGHDLLDPAAVTLPPDADPDAAPITSPAPPPPPSPARPSDPPPAPPSGPTAAPTPDPASVSSVAPPPVRPPAVGPGRSGSSVRAVRCPGGHPNPVTALRCRSCDRVIEDRAIEVVERPVLARLVFDSGMVVEVDRPLVIGRRPVRPDGWSVEPRLVRLGSVDGALSRVHAIVHVEGWDLMLEDAGSLNGTELLLPDGSRRRLPEHESVPVEPASVVVLGGTESFRIEAVAGP